MFKYIFSTITALLLCLPVLPIIVTAPNLPQMQTDTYSLSIGDTMNMRQTKLILSGFYENSIVIEGREEWCQPEGKTCSMRSHNIPFYIPQQVGFEFSVPSDPRYIASIVDYDLESGSITIKLTDTIETE